MFVDFNHKNDQNWKSLPKLEFSFFSKNSKTRALLEPKLHHMFSGKYEKGMANKLKLFQP